MEREEETLNQLSSPKVLFNSLNIALDRNVDNLSFSLQMVQTWGILIYEEKSLSLRLVFNFLGLSMITQYLVYPIETIDFNNVKRRLGRQTALYYSQPYQLNLKINSCKFESTRKLLEATLKFGIFDKPVLWRIASSWWFSEADRLNG